MKKLKNKRLLSLLILVISLVSCDEDEFLKEVNPNTLTADTFWKTQEQFNSALTTVYGALQFQSLSGSTLANEMLLSDIAGTENWHRPHYDFRNLTYNDASSYVTNKWNAAYIGIFRANQLIGQIQSADPSVIFSGNSKVSMIAQARFLRAFFYFEIAHSYGKGIIHTTVPKVGEFNKDLSTKEEILENVIKPDLEYAKTNLPQNWDGDNLGRVTWGAATSLLGKAYLYNEEWTMASKSFEEVINSNIYSLTPEIMDNFRHDTEFNSESIFEIAFEDVSGPGISGDEIDDVPNNNGSESTSLARAVGHFARGGWSVVLSSYYLHEMLINDVIDPNNPINASKLNGGLVHSNRLNATIAPRNGEGLYYKQEFPDLPGWGFGHSAYVKKHSEWYHKENESTIEFGGRSPINFRAIRLADVYLMYAEAVLNDSGDTGKAVRYIDMVRSRAGVITLQDYMDNNGGMFPQLHVSIQVHGTQPMVVLNTENIMTHLRRVERPSELCFEGYRNKDLVRWGIKKDIFSELASDETWRETNKETTLDVNNGGVAPLFIVTRIRPDFTVTNRSYTPSQHDYLPIPTGEVQTNGNLITDN